MNSIKDLFQSALELMNQHTDFVFVTIIASSGSSPRGAGSRMLVLPDGSTLGTIGGGNVEYTASRQALEVLRDKSSYTQGYHLHKGEVADLGMVCGGDVTVYFQYISCHNEEFRQLCQSLLNDWDLNKDCWLLMDITDETAWSAGFYGSYSGLVGVSLQDPADLLTSKAHQTTIEGRRIYSEPLLRAGSVYVFGGGHVAQELVPVLSRVGFRCIVFDDREAFARKELFPDAFACIVGDFERISDYVTPEAEDYICIMTRGHQFDYLVQKQLILSPACYIGVMGSKKKTASVRERLLADGFTDPQIDRFTTPIGLNIKAETPAEIAISIAGQLIEVRAMKQKTNA